MESVLLERDMIEAPTDSVDLVVVHTCSVTMNAAAKSRQTIRRAARAEGSVTPTVIVTGCMSGTDPAIAASLAGDTSNVIAHHDPSDARTLVERFAARIDGWLEITPAPLSPPETNDVLTEVVSLPVIPAQTSTSRHHRAELRIQDGCDAHCTFCIIPKLRRTLRSKRICDAIDEARQLVELGHREIVLAGIFIGAYGHETSLRRRQRDPDGEHLADLLDAVANVQGLARLRISSMEPGDVTSVLLDAMVANAGVVVPHLHLPLQSGSDAILARMNRQYRIDAYQEMIAMTKSALSQGSLEPAITTDIICGFPGETHEDFMATVAIANDVGFLHMHVFPYSARPGTAAARWTSLHVPHATIKARVRHLINLEEDPDGLSIQYRRQLVGRQVRVIVEGPGETSGSLQGRCDHYAMIQCIGDGKAGEVINAVVENVTATTTVGRQIQVAQPLPLLHLPR
jgi:threonylcarbamoyladenosine tRNA methylthiotransferase MtaB